MYLSRDRASFDHTTFIFQSGDNPVGNRPLQKCLARDLPGQFISQVQVNTDYPCGPDFSDVHARLDSLRRVVRDCPSDDIVLIARSSGARVATLLAATTPDPRISSVICFSYPFRNPSRPPEPERVAHLAALDVPTLIVQGDADPYGGTAIHERYRLSAAIRTVFVPGDHAPAFTPEGWGVIMGDILEHALAARAFRYPVHRRA